MQNEDEDACAVLRRELALRSIKVVNIGWACVAYFFLAVLVDEVLDRIFGRIDVQHYVQHASGVRIFFEILGYTWLLGTLSYIIRNLFERIPFPFDGVMGYDHRRVQEVKDADVFSTFLIFFNRRMQAYYTIFRKRFL
ncbi:hypothetical protein EBZ80_12265 [bacterium]|nr:hypothetical protein [bacterium]